MPSLKRFRKILAGEPKNEIVEEPPEAIEDEAPVVVEEVVYETSTDILSSKLKAVFGFQKETLTVEEHSENIEGMTKLELDEYAEKYDIYLDRRQNKQNMINEFIQKLKEKQ